MTNEKLLINEQFTTSSSALLKILGTLLLMTRYEFSYRRSLWSQPTSMLLISLGYCHTIVLRLSVAVFVLVWVRMMMLMDRTDGTWSMVCTCYHWTPRSLCITFGTDMHRRECVQMVWITWGLPWCWVSYLQSDRQETGKLMRDKTSACGRRGINWSSHER